MPELTTAVLLGRFYAELIEEKIPDHLAMDIVRRAAETITHNDGVGVKAVSA